MYTFINRRKLNGANKGCSKMVIICLNIITVNIINMRRTLVSDRQRYASIVYSFKTDDNSAWTNILFKDYFKTFDTVI